MLSRLATLLERVNCFFFISEVNKILNFNLWWKKSCNVGNNVFNSEVECSTSVNAYFVPLVTEKVVLASENLF